MRPWVFVALAACSPSREEATPASRHEEPRHSIDVTVEHAAIKIRGVEIARSGKNLELGYRIEGQSDAVVPAEIMCRVQDYNLIYPTSSTGKVPGPRLTATFRPDPFDEVPQLCEVRFTLAAGGVRPIARACFRNETLVDGACPEGSFPRRTPALVHENADIQIDHGKLELGADAAVLTAVFTKNAGATGRYAAQLACPDAAGPITGEAGFAILPLDRMDVDTSVYGPVPILLDRVPHAACDLRIVSRATQGPPEERLHAEYCVTTEAIRVGRCSPN